MTEIRGQKSEVSKRLVLSGMLIALGGVAALLLAVFTVAEAQQAVKVPRIGVLRLGDQPTAPSHEAFRKGLSDLGYVEGKNILIEYRSTDIGGKRLTELATELVHLKVDVIVAGSTAQRGLPSKRL